MKHRVAISAVLCAAAYAAATQPVVILDRQLRATTGEIRRITPKALALAPYPATEPERTMPLDEIALIVQPWWWSPDRQSVPVPAATIGPGGISTGLGPPAGSARVELTDGRVLQGKLDLPAEPLSGDAAAPDLAAAKDSIAWDHPILGRLVLRLEDVRRITLPLSPAAAQDQKPDGAAPAAPGPAAADAKRDAVILLNGDEVRGFVEHVGSEVWVAEGSGKNVTKVPASRVREIVLVNPPVRPSGARVWIEGAWSVGVDYLGADPQRGLALGIEPAKGKSRQIFVRQDQLIAIAPAAERLTPLAKLVPVRVTGPADRPFVAPPALGEADPLLGAADVEIPGPMTVEWALPAGAERLGGWLVLPPAYHEWGDCVIRIDTVDAKGVAAEVARESLNGERALVPLSVALPAGARVLRLTLDAGAYGPIQDRVVIRRALILSR